MHFQLSLLKSNLCFNVAALAVTLFLAGHSFGQDTPQPAATPAQEEGTNLGDVIKTANLATLKDLAKKTEPLIDQGQFDQALVVYSALSARLAEVQSSPDFDPSTQNAAGLLSLDLLTGQGRALAGLQEYTGALEMFKEVLDKQENYPATLVARGEMMLDAGQPAQAQPDFEKAVQASRDYLRAVFDLGKAHILQGHYDDGIRSLSRFLQAGQTPLTAEAYRMRGVGNGGLFKFDKALADINKSLEINPDAYETYFELGVVYLRKEDFSAATEALGKAIERYKPKPGHEEDIYFQGPLLKASAHVEVGKKATDEATRKAAYQAAVDESQQLLLKYDEKSPYTAQQRAAILVARGIGERMLGRMGDAIRTFSQAIELNPELGEAYFRRGICLQQIGENRMAVNDFTQAATISYDDPRGNLWEGFVYAKLGDYYEAIRAYGDAIAASDRYTPAFVNRGLAYMQLGDNEKAVADFNDALRIEPTNGDYYFKRGVAYVQLGQLDKASDSLASAISFDPNHREAYRYMADVMQKQGHADLAEQYRKKAAELEKKPGDRSEPLEKSAGPR